MCRGTLQLLCGGGDMVEAILMQCPPLPDSAPILLFPFRCDSCWDWLLGDHIPGTKRAQLVWTGLSDTTSCSGCESLLSKQPFSIENIKKKKKTTCHVYFTCLHSIIGCDLCEHTLACVYVCVFFFFYFIFLSALLVPKIWEGVAGCLPGIFKMAAFHALTFLFSLMDSADSPLAPLCKCCEQNHSHFSLKCCCFAAQSGRVGPVASGLAFLQQIRIILFALMGGLIIPWVYGGGKKVHYFICPHCFYIRLESVYLIAGSHFVFFPLW